MDREQLFQNLNELEKQLKGIKSATEHVNQVVAADHELVKAVDDFTKEAVRLIESTRGTFEAEIKVMQKAASETLNKSAADFSAKIQSITSELTMNVGALKNTVEDSIKPMVGETVGVIEHTLKPFVKDEMPKTFGGFMDKYKALFDKAAGDVSASSELFAEQAGAGVEQLRQTVLAIHEPQEQIKSLLEQVRKSTDASIELIRQDVEVSSKAGEDTICAAKKIDEVSKTISSSIADVQKSIGVTAQTITEYMKDSDDKIREELSDFHARLHQVPEQLASLQSIMESSFLSVNTTLSTLLAKVDTIAKNTKQIASIDSRLLNISKEVDEQRNVIEGMRRENESFKTLLTISLIVNFCAALGVLFIITTK